MLAVIAAILSALGVLLNWPFFPGGFFPLALSGLSTVTVTFGPGYGIMMGKMVLAVALFTGCTFFLRPSILLLRIRSITLGAAVILVAMTAIQALRMPFPFHSCTGPVFSFVLLGIALLATVMRIGAVAPRTGRSQPTGAEGASMRLDSFFARSMPGSQAKKLYVTALDDLHEQWPRDVTRAFDKREITFGRDGQWADIQVGGEWGAVSNRHGKARVIGNSVFYEPIAGHYAFALDDKPCQTSKEMHQGAILSLVSGLGPRLKLELKEGGQKGDIIPEIELKNEIDEDHARLMRATLRNMVILTLLSLALFGAFLAVQRLGSG